MILTARHPENDNWLIYVPCWYSQKTESFQPLKEGQYFPTRYAALVACCDHLYTEFRCFMTRFAEFLGQLGGSVDSAATGPIHAELPELVALAKELSRNILDISDAPPAQHPLDEQHDDHAHVLRSETHVTEIGDLIGLYGVNIDDGSTLFIECLDPVPQLSTEHVACLRLAATALNALLQCIHAVPAGNKPLH